MVDHARAREREQREAEHRTSGAGYAAGGRTKSDVSQDAEMVEKGVHQHERNMHKGWPETKLKLRARGGSLVEGVKPTHSNGKRARGAPKITLVVHNQPMHPAEKQQAQQQGAMQGMRIGAALGARKAAQQMAAGPKPGMGPPPGLPTAPPGAGPMMPPRPGMLPTAPGAGPMARGGDVKVRAHTRRRAGGKL